jgi:phosphoribosylglycinamide formyltransferase 2
MKDAGFVRSIVEKEKPDYIVPEIEAINLDLLFDLEKEGWNIIPNAKASHAAMQRERIRELIKNAGVETSKYFYAETLDEMKAACEKVGYPCWVKAIMDSSGHGSSFVKAPEDVEPAFNKARNEARGSGEKMIIEQHIPFDTEVTELAVRHFDENGNIVTSFPRPVGHYQTRGGDYHSSWQMAEISEKAEKGIYSAAKKITDALGGLGLFGCELFVKGDKVYGNECSPRPHDTGMVTFASHQVGFSQAGLHVRAITGLPVPTEERLGHNVVPMITPAATHVLLSPYEGWDLAFGNTFKALNAKGISFMAFGKPEAHINRRMGIVLATAETVKEAKEKAERAAHLINMKTRQFPEWRPQQDKEKHLIK